MRRWTGCKRCGLRGCVEGAARSPHMDSTACNRVQGFRPSTLIPVPVTPPIGTPRVDTRPVISLGGIGIRATIVPVVPLVIAITVCGAADVDSEPRSLNIHVLRCGRRHAGCPGG